MIRSYLNIALRGIEEMETRRLSKLEEIKAEYIATRNLPRKKKKARRKELELDYRIFSWNPFDFI